LWGIPRFTRRVTVSTPLIFSDYLAEEWRPSLGCTEPAAIAYATARAASCRPGAVRGIRLECDARTYKNCHSVGIPNSGGRTGILWTLALGAHLGDASKGLRCFEDITPETLAEAARVLENDAIRVEVAPPETGLWIDVTVIRDGGQARVVIAREHTRVARVELDGEVLEEADHGEADGRPSVREVLARMNLAEMVELARGIGAADRLLLREGAAMNLAMAEQAMDLLPPGFIGEGDDLTHARFAMKVAAGVYGRMSGVAAPVMSLAGSGNKGITVAVPLSLYGQTIGAPRERIDEALALACLLTSATTWHLGTLSAMCGAANAAGIGVTAGVVWLKGGGLREIGTAIGTMVGNLAGMVCDGAKIGCAMKTMTGVDAAFRAANLAMLGLGVPATDGIVGADGNASLRNLGRLACQGMAGADAEILAIMQAKLRPSVVSL
jgi:L-cysteine desulfidase